MSIAVIDYGSGNLKSAAKALETAAKNINIGSKIVVTSDPKPIEQSDKIVLPGQGSFRDCYLGIQKIPGLIEALNECVLIKKKPIFGICVGMQLLTQKGFEYGESPGLNLIDGICVKMNTKLRLPNIGWGLVTQTKPSKLLEGIQDPHFYFMHSYEVINTDLIYNY